MGAELLTRTYDKTNRENLKELIHSNQDQDRWEDGCSYSGSWGVKDSDLNFVSKKFNNEEECEDYIANNNDKWGGLDVCYFDNSNSLTKTKSKSFQSLSLKVENIEQDILNLHKLFKLEKQKIHTNVLNKTKSKTKTCKHCNTTITLSKLKTMECPNCKTILLSNTDIKKLDTLSKRHFTKLEKLNEKLKIQKNKIYDFKKLNNIKNGFVAGGWCSS